MEMFIAHRRYVTYRPFLLMNLKHLAAKILHKVPLLDDPTERFLLQVKEAAKAGLSGGKT